ncbi:MAG: proton-conducting transporter membrane subunit, partial [Holophagaceae bacterium]
KAVSVVPFWLLDIFMIMTMSSIGLPLLNGFIGELIILQGSFQAFPWAAVVATTGIILGAAYMLWMFQRVMFGPISDVNRKMTDLTPREMVVFAPLVIMAVWIGLYPRPLMEIMDRPVAKLVRQVNPDYYLAPSASSDQEKAKREGMQGMVAPGTDENSNLTETSEEK